MTRELRLIPVTMPLAPANAPAGAAPAGGGGGRRTVREDEFWSVAAGLLASGLISEDEYAAIVGATSVVPVGD